MDFSQYSPLLLALVGTTFTFLCTTLGSSFVFLVRGKDNERYQRLFLGFAAGVMIAASVWSLIIPAIDMAEAQGKTGWIPAAGGFLLGALFLLLLDTLMPHLHLGSDKPEGVKSNLSRSTMLILAITLHNIPEGLAVGLTFGLVAHAADPVAALATAFALALGIGIQNIPEGAAISLPLRSEGFSRRRAFLYGSLSGVVEPISAVLGVLIISILGGIMPWLLAFAAGAMMYVVVEELIPAANPNPDEHSNLGTIGVMLGFVLMMVLDVVLG